MSTEALHSGLQQLCFGLAERQEKGLLDAKIIVRCLFGYGLEHASNVSNAWKASPANRRKAFLDAWRKAGDLDAQELAKAEERAAVQALTALVTRCRRQNPEAARAVDTLLGRRKYADGLAEGPQKLRAQCTRFVRKAKADDRERLAALLGIAMPSVAERRRALYELRASETQRAFAQERAAAGVSSESSPFTWSEPYGFALDLTCEQRAFAGWDAYGEQAALERCLTWLADEDPASRCAPIPEARLTRQAALQEGEPFYQGFREELADGYFGDFPGVVRALLPALAAGFQAQRYPRLAVDAFCRDLAELALTPTREPAERNERLLRRLVAACVFGPGHPCALSEQAGETRRASAFEAGSALQEGMRLALMPILDDRAARVGAQVCLGRGEAVFLGRSSDAGKYVAAAASIEGLASLLARKQCHVLRIPAGHSAVSGVHGAIVHDGDGWWLYDLGSRFGTLVLSVDPQRDCTLGLPESAEGSTARSLAQSETPSGAAPTSPPRACCLLEAGDTVHLGIGAAAGARERLDAAALFETGAAFLISESVAPAWDA